MKLSSIGIFTVMLICASCGGKRQAEVSDSDILLQVNDSVLYLHDVVSRIPAGLSEEDSLEMFDRIVEAWTEVNVLEGVAKENVIDLNRIDRMVATYRSRLIVDEYLRLMEEASAGKVSGEEIKEYYESNKEDLITSGPLIKGIYIKTSEEDESLPDLRRWMQTAIPSSLDNIEKFGLKQANQYEYFMDKWIDWHALADQIPYRFYDGDAFLSTTKDFETSYEGSVYLLHISDYLPSGSNMPYDYAHRKISERLNSQKRVEYRNNLKRTIYRDAIKKGILKPGSYNPIK